MFPPEFNDAFEYWKHSAKPTRGEDDYPAIYCAVGEALSHWEMLETAMAHLFATLTGTGSEAAARAYGTISNSVGRRKALDAASEAFFVQKNAPAKKGDGTSIRELFATLMKNYSEAGGRRNDIAHGLAGSFEGMSLGIVLIPADYNTSKRRFVYPPAKVQDHSSLERYTYVFTSEHILGYARKFDALFFGVFTFHQVLDTIFACGGPRLVLCEALPDGET